MKRSKKFKFKLMNFKAIFLMKDHKKNQEKQLNKVFIVRILKIEIKKNKRKIK